MKSLDQLPPLSATLVETLDKLYPPKCIRRGESPEDAHRYAGKRELVESLIQLLEKTEDSVLQK